MKIELIKDLEKLISDLERLIAEYDDEDVDERKISELDSALSYLQSVYEQVNR